MKVTSNWQEGFKSVIDNGRDHNVTVDLPYLQHGKDEGPTSLELAVMGYAGCVTTIFKMMAEKLKVDVSAMRCVVNTEYGDKTIEKAEVILELSSQASPKLIKKAYQLTQEHCPVGVLFENSGVDVEYKINIQGSEI
ncbi:MAG: OsmC family protein [Candidatus Delongbacteria bacterium]|jgi:uncharacterized OsmC-like protein|nr:OsmC family protein [Candidatus Delongbacteria bacterium]